MGHLDWMKTHFLSAPGAPRARRQSKIAKRAGGQELAMVGRQREEAGTFARSNAPGKLRSFPSSGSLPPAKLQHVAYDPHNPYWVVQASKEVIDGHNGIFGDVFNGFVRGLVMEHL